MGNFLSSIEGKTVSVDSALLNSTHSKLIQYYSSYKSICEGFTINIPEYTQIFGPNQQSFALWDSKGKGKIDAIQMFSGLLIFSKIKYEQKIKFLFEIFDFNEEGFLLYENLAFMLLNICNATYKILSVSKPIIQGQIESFLDEYFTQDSKVQLAKLIRWTTKNNMVIEYFKKIGHQIDQPVDQRRIALFSTSWAESRRKKIPPLISDKQFRLDAKYINCLESLVNNKRVFQQQMLNLKLKWIYGIDIGKQNIKFVVTERKKAGNQRIIYAVGKIIVIYYPKLNIQRYYKGHNESISVIQVSRSKRLVASSQSGQSPSIDIWNIQNQINLIKFKKIHKDKIKYIKFFKDDKYLITASESLKVGGQIESPIIILRLDTKEIVMSTYLNTDLIGILPIQSAKQSTALLISKASFTLLIQQNRQYTVKKVQVKNTCHPKEIIAFAQHPKGYLITAHKSRQFCRWDQDYNCHNIASFGECKREVIQLLLIGQQTLLVLDQIDIQIISLKIEDEIVFKERTMINLSGSKLFNLRLYTMQIVQPNKILAVSQFGDVIQVSDIESSKPTLKKYYQLFKMDQVSNILLPNPNEIVFVTSFFIYAVDRFQKELKALYKQDGQIKLSDSFRQRLIISKIVDNQSVLTIFSLNDYAYKQTYNLPYLFEDIKITQNHVLALSQISLYIFHRVQDKYLSKQPICHKLAIGKMLSFAKQTDQRNFIIVNQAKQLFKVTINGNSVDIHKIDKQANLQYQQISLSYPQHNYKYPFLFSSNRRFVALGRKNGEILIWESLSAALNYFSSHTLVNLHAGRITKLLLSHEQWFTAGGFNGMVIHYQHQKYIQLQEDNQIEQLQDEEVNILQKKPVTKTKWRQNQIDTSISYKELQGVGLREGQVEIEGIIDNQDKQVYALILQMLTPFNKMSLEPKTQGYSNKLVLEADYIYGIDVSLFSKNVHYIHSYPSQSTIKPIDISLWHEDSSQMNKEQVKYCKNSLLPIDEDHSNCKRQILYSSDKYCVINEKNSPQKLYKFHRRKVSAIALHPKKQLICSCQVSDSFAQIHIWKYNEQNLEIALISKHRSIISKAQFSRDGDWIVTLGGFQRAQSIQILNWQSQETIAFRFIEDESIRQILFNPYDKKQICLAGLNLIRIYRVEEQLIIKEQCRILQQNFQAIVYISNIYGSQIESDVITGSLEGDIGLYVCGSFLYSRKKAHEKGITCLRLVELFQYKKVLVSGGGDGFVRIWDIKFNEISKKNIRDQLYAIKSTDSEMPETIIVNLDIYQCQRKQGNQNIASAVMLIATSDGSVLEATITNEFQGYKAVNMATAQTQPLKQKINLDVSLVLASPPNLNSFRYVTCNSLLITFSSRSKFVYFWNMSFRTRQRVFSLPSPPLFLIKANKRPILVVSLQQYSSAILKMYQLEFSGGVYLRSITQYGQIQLQKGNFLPLNGYFSTSDNQLALQIRNEGSSQVWLYKKEGIYNYQFVFRVTIESMFKVVWIQFSIKQETFLVAQEEIKKQTHANGQVRYKCYSSSNGSSIGLCSQFDRFDFSQKIKAQYIPCSYLTAQSAKDYSSKDSVKVTVMVQYKQYLLMGTASGQILIAQGQIFAKRQINPRYYARCYIVCDSPINKLEVHQSDLIVGNLLGESILVLKMRVEKGLMNKQACIDPFNQSYSYQELEKRYKQIYMKRKKIQNESESSNTNCHVSLKLTAVLGRNAFYKRNNIFIDLKDNIISFSGCNLLIMRHQQGQRLNQKIIKPDISSNASHPQISCMALGQCKKFLLIGSVQQNAKIIAWDISTNTYLFDMKLYGCISINLVKLSSSKKHSIIYATAKNNHKYLYFVDVINRSVIAVHHFHNSIQINDLLFAPSQQYRILACGARYMAEWNFCNGILTEKMYSFNFQESQDIKKITTIFYSLIFIEEYAITCGSDGYLYIWKDEKLLKRQNAHPKESILTLYTSINSKIFVSGANNGIVIIWHFSSSLIIQKLDEYNTYFGKEHMVPIKHQIQSICMTKESLVIGNRAGEIMHFPFSNSKALEDNPNIPQSKIPLPILSSFNHVPINSCAFNQLSKRLYVMTEADFGFGTFAVFDISTLQKIKQQKIELKSPLVCMFVCKKSTKIFFILKNLIFTYIYPAQGKDDKNKLTKGKQILKFDLQIKNAALNAAQDLLAVLVAPGSIQNARIQIYNLNAPKDQFFVIHQSYENLQASIDVIDFSKDNNYLVYYQGNEEEQTIIDLMTKQKVKAAALEKPPQWNEQANKTTPSIRQITTFYSQQNKLLKVVQVLNKCVIATDEVGSVRVFPFPITANKEQNYQTYIEHLNQVYLCVVSLDSRTLVTVSRQDRAIHLWSVINQEE